MITDFFLLVSLPNFIYITFGNLLTEKYYFTLHFQKYGNHERNIIWGICLFNGTFSELIF